jgi:DNA-directed RNA polymerase specialized sigma subunit
MLAARKALGLSQADVAKLADTTTAVVSRLECLKFRMWDIGRAGRIADVLGLAFDEVMPPDAIDKIFTSKYERVTDMSAHQLLGTACVRSVEVLDTPESILIDRENAQGIIGMLEQLSAQERNVIIRYFGIGVPEQNECEIAQSLSVTRQCISHLLIRALHRMRTHTPNQHRNRK